MNCSIHSDDGSDIHIHITQLSSGDKNEFKSEYWDRKHVGLRYFSFDNVHLFLIRADIGKIRVTSQPAESFVAAYGLITGELKSENASGEVIYFHLTAGQHNVYYPASLINCLYMEAPLQAFILYLPEIFLSRYITGEPGISSFLLKHISKRKAFITETLPVTPDITKIINSLTHTRHKGDILRLLLGARVLELLSYQLEQLDLAYQRHSGASFLKEHDIHKIHIAKTLIERNIRTPCSLIELSRKVGLNDFKLKKGFREILGTTVFGYLSDLRMEQAWALLLQKKSVSEVAYEVGYKNPHHFTAAFKKKFGMLPSVFNK